jgi:hypothetical protein
MSKKGDYIPRKDSDLMLWGANFTAEVAANAERWGIPAGEVADLQTTQASFVSLHKQASSPEKNAIIVEEKNATRKVLEEKIRTMVGFRLKNPVITNADRLSLGLHVYDKSRTTIPVPKSRPGFDVEVLDFRRLKIRFHDRDSEGAAKPYGISGAVILYAVLDSPPANVNALTRSVLATRTPHILEFVEEERSKTVYIAICWQNEKGEKGQWSEIESAIVP